MTQRASNPEQYFEVPEPVRARHYDMNIAVDTSLSVLEVNYDVSEPAAVPASQEVRQHEAVVMGKKAENPLFSRPVPLSAEVTLHAAQAETDRTEPISHLNRVNTDMSREKIDEMLDQEQRIAALRTQINSLNYDSHHDISENH